MRKILRTDYQKQDKQLQQAMQKRNFADVFYMSQTWENSIYNNQNN